MTTKNKEQACIKLVSLKKKKITNETFEAVSKEFSLSDAALRNAWRVFQETGGKYVDKRCRKNGTVGNFVAKGSAAKVLTVTKMNRTVTKEMAGSIITEYMTTNIKIVDLCNKHSITAVQFYNWIHELDVEGSLFGKIVLNPKKYAKINTLDVIHFNKYPSSRKKTIVNLSETEKAAYRRVAEILLMYLPKTEV